MHRYGAATQKNFYMAKYLDAAGVRALAESAKSYFAGLEDLVEVNEHIEFAFQRIQYAEDDLSNLMRVVNCSTVGESISSLNTIYADSNNYSLTASRGCYVAPLVPPGVDTVTCKNTTALRYFPTACIPFVTSLASSLSSCVMLELVGDLIASACTSLSQTFYNSYRLVKVGDIYAPKCTDASNMFAGCNALRWLGRLDIGTPANVKGMFKLCSEIKVIPAIDTSAATDMSEMFDGADNVERIEGISFKSATGVLSIFNQMGQNVRYARLLDIGYTDVVPEIGKLSQWGTGGAENLESMRYSLVESTCDRAAAGKSNLTLRPSSATYALLTSDDRAKLSAKGYTVFPTNS